jgi:hypothetical protein
MYKVEVTPVIGLPQFTGWSHVLTNSSRLGQFVCAFAVSGEHAGNVGRDLTHMIEDSSVETAASVHELISLLQKTAEEMGTKLSIACGLFSHGRLVMGALQGSVFLKRGDRMGVLLNAKDEINIVEGKNKIEDVVVFATAQAHHFLPEIEQRFLTGFEIDSVISSIIPGLHSLDNSSLSSLAFVFGGREIEISEPVVEPEPEQELENALPISFAIESDEPEIDEGTTSPTTTQTIESLEEVIPIPPALKLRGAGKHRDDERDDGSHNDDPMLSELGAELGQAQVGVSRKPDVVGAKKPNQFATVIQKVLSSIKLKAWLIAVWQFIVRVVQNTVRTIKQFRSGDVYVQQQSPRQLLRRVLPIGLGVLIIGGAIIWWLLSSRAQARAAEAALAPVRMQLIQALSELNANPIQAREMARVAVADLEQLEKDFERRPTGKKLIVEELEKARTFYNDISGEVAVQDLEIFYDLRLVDSEFVANRVDANNEQAVFMDGERKRAIVLTLENKQARSVSLDKLSAVKDLSVNESTVTFLGNGVFQGSTTSDSAPESAIEEGDSNRGGTLIETFASYVYVLNPEKRNIYRYSKQDDSFSDPIGWISGAVRFDFNTVTSWTIDGQIWVTTQDGVVHLLASGGEEQFEIKGLSKPFEHSLLVYTRDDLENIYVLEANAQRLVTIKKDGTFIKEVTSPSLASATGLFVDAAGTKAYAVSGSIVYALSL